MGGHCIIFNKVPKKESPKKLRGSKKLGVFIKTNKKDRGV